MVSHAKHFDGKADENASRDEIKLCEVFCDNEPTIKRCMKPGRWTAKRKVHINHTKSVEYTNPDSPLQICKLTHVKSADNPADVFTKIAENGARENWYKLRMRIMNLPTLRGYKTF